VGFAWNGKSYGSLSQIAKAMTGMWSEKGVSKASTCQAFFRSRDFRNEEPGRVSGPPSRFERLKS
jgi:hypothetical protein